MLATAEAVIRRAGVAQLPEYEDVAPLSECAGFYAYRRYPPTTQLSSIITKHGRPGVRCYLSFVVSPAKVGAVSRVELNVWLARRWMPPGRILTSYTENFLPGPGNVDAPTPSSLAILNRTRKPIDLDAVDVGDFLYDHHEDVFLDVKGSRVTPAQILEIAYAKHCRTLRLGFRIRWNIGTVVRWIATRAVWRGQDAAMWALFNLYDVELADKKLRELRERGFRDPDPFRRYKPSDFCRSTDNPGERSNFFGFQSSQKSLFTNLSAVVLTCLVLYWNAPHAGLLKTIYNNTALTTAALVLAFLLADKIGPWLLIGTICLLSRFREAVIFFVRKVRV